MYSLFHYCSFLSYLPNRQKFDRGEEVFPNQGGGQQQGHPFGHGGFNPFGHGGGGQQFHFQWG